MKPYLSVFLVSILLFFATDLIAQKDIAISVETGIIPPEFNKNNDTLLIAATGNPFYIMSMKKHFKKSYTGPFLVVKSFEGHSIENCRYVFYEGTATNTKYHVDGPNKGQHTSSTQHSNFYILDRKTKEEYGNSNLPSPKLIKAYITGLDKARQGIK